MAGAVLGGLGTLFSGLALVGLLAFWSQYMQYGNCLNGATTAAARTPASSSSRTRSATGSRSSATGDAGYRPG